MASARPIYLDHHATTPVDPRVLEQMLPYFNQIFGNASSRQHAFGWRADEAVERARQQVAQLIGARAKEIVFTSGATEANSLAIRGAVAARRSLGAHVVTVTTEHKAVLDVCASLEREGCTVTRVPVEGDGRVDLDRFAAALRPDTVLASVMIANNEIGVVQPVADLARACHARGVWLHTDAVQAAGHVPVDVNALDVDLASFSAHKMYGPKGVGALYVRRTPKVELVPQLVGGGQERGLRAGTLNVPGIVGLGAAAAIGRAEMAAEAGRVAGLRDRLLEALRRGLGDVTVNGSQTFRLPHNLHVAFEGVDGEALMTSLADDVAVSSGSACASGSREPSHVMTALGRTAADSWGAVRFGLGRSTTAEDIDTAAARVCEHVSRLRAMSPVALGTRA
jgi:cysteine desulfurase